jgi:uncharacterized protein YndB with AHSA1/START domain
MTESATFDLLITRTFNAPRELVWKAWTEPEHMMRWWGPKHFTSPACKLDFRVGGTYLVCMRGPDGKDYWSTGKYLEIIPLEKIVCTDNFADAEGNIVPASYYGMEGEWPGDDELVFTLTFSEAGSQTTLTLRHTGLPVAVKEMTGTGWNEMLDKLVDYLHEGEEAKS